MPAPGMSRSAVRPAHATRTPSAVNPYARGKELAVLAAMTRPAAASYRTTAKAPSVSWRSPRVVRRALTRWRVSPWSVAS